MFSRKTRKNRIIIPVALVASAGAAVANAATIVWNGNGGDLNWNTLTNWSTGALPSDIAQFQENGYNSGDTVTVATDQTVNRLAFNFSSTNAASKDLTLTGAPITLTGLAANSNGFNRANTVSGIQTINNNIVLGGSQKWNIAGNTSAPGGVGRLIVNGVIGETAGGSKDLTKDGNTNLELNGNNTFTGLTTIIQNTIVVGNANALGLGTSAVLVGDTAVNTSQSNLVTKTGVTFARDVEVRSGQTGGSRLGGADGLGLTTWTGTISIEKDVIVTGGLGVATGTADFRGNLVDGANSFVSSNVTKQNGGVVKLSGTANTYSGTTTINAGTLLVNGVLSNNDAAVTATNTARLGGLGTINRPVYIAGGATLSPGDGGAGVLTVGGGKTLTLDDGAVLEWDAGATPAASDQVVASAVSFGAGATLKILSNPNLPDTNASYVLLSWTGDDPATLANWTVDPSSAWTGSISYVNAADGLPGGEVVLSNAAAVQAPEPSTCASLAAVMSLVVLRRRRKR
jgi:autotransporter-associated beta strand protein